MDLFHLIKKQAARFWKNAAAWASRHKATAVLLAVILAWGGYFILGKVRGVQTETKYVLAEVQKGTLVVSVSGAGQVSASNQVDIKPKASGDIVYVGVKNGQEVKAGTLLAQIDARDAQKAVRDAEMNLESAKLGLERIEGSGSPDVPKVKIQAQDDLKKAYSDAFNAVAKAFLDLPSVVSGLSDILNGTTQAVGGRTQYVDANYYNDLILDYDTRIKLSVAKFRDDALSRYRAARAAYDLNVESYKNLTRESPVDSIDSVLAQTHETAKLVSDAVKNAKNFLDLVNGAVSSPPSILTSHITNLQNYVGLTNSYVSSLLDARRAIDNAEEAISGADFDVASQKFAVKQRENALLDAREKLADYFIRAPFSGIVAAINVKKGDPVSGSAAMATLITRQRIAEISMNEVDVAKVKASQKATLTFDAISDLSITGEVSEIGAIGAISQGVVSYAVKLAFDTQDERVKPGMSVSAAIITEARQDVLLVPNSAVKQQGDANYIEVPHAADTGALSTSSAGVVFGNSPIRKQVEIGILNDEFTEITSGISEGELIVARTVQAALQNTQQQPVGVRVPGLGGFR